MSRLLFEHNICIENRAMFDFLKIINSVLELFALVVSNVVCNFPVTCLAPKRLRHRRPTIAVP